MADPAHLGRCTIVSGPASGDAWSEQLDMLRATGAQFDSVDRRWFFFFEQGCPPIDKLNALFAISARFGAQVVLDEIPAPE